jgi:NADP-dependent 3-hydroxy acid dehydrogenase YdfG
MAEALAAAGARVGATSRSRERAEATARELGREVVGFELDVRDEQSVAVFAAEARECFRRATA